jgi:hypothetical protein
LKIVFYTRQGFESSELFLYMFARLSAKYPGSEVAAVYPAAARQGLPARFARHWKKMQRLGVWQTLEISSSYPLQAYFAGRDRTRVNTLLRQLPRPAVKPDLDSVKIVSTVNGPDAVATIESMRPDVIIQAGAGILRPQIFNLARIACLNMHHGIAPLIRGMNSIYWGLWENQPQWIGSTIHKIDAGIDTGDVLAYAPVRPRHPGEGFAPLFVRATEQGIDRMLEALARLQAGERWKVEPPPGASEYRSTISGWKLAALALRLNAQRMTAAKTYGQVSGS